MRNLAVFDGGALVAVALPATAGGSSPLRVYERSAAGWRAVTLLDDRGRAALTGASSFLIAANARGDATVTWSQAEEDGTGCEQRAGRDEGGRWISGGSPYAAFEEDGRVVAAATTSTSSLLTMSPSGVATIVAGNFLIDRAPGGTWTPGPGIVYDPTSSVLDTVAAYDGTGALWVGYLGGALNGPESAAFATYVTRRPAGGGALEPAVLIGDGSLQGLAVDATGNAAVSYDDRASSLDDEPRSTLVRVHPAGGTWEPPVTLPEPLSNGISQPAGVAVGPGAATAVLWSRATENTSPAVLVSARDGSGATPDTTVPVLLRAALDPYVFTSDAATTLRVAVSEPARVHAAVESYDPLRGFVPALGVLGADPLIVRGRQGTFTVPGTDFAGTRLAFRPGAHRLTVTATDAAGNTSAPLVTYAYVPR